MFHSDNFLFCWCLQARASNEKTGRLNFGDGNVATCCDITKSDWKWLNHKAVFLQFKTETFRETRWEVWLPDGERFGAPRELFLVPERCLKVCRTLKNRCCSCFLCFSHTRCFSVCSITTRTLNSSVMDPFMWVERRRSRIPSTEWCSK